MLVSTVNLLYNQQEDKEVLEKIMKIKIPKKWTKFRHRVVFAILRPIFKLYFKLKYRLKYSVDEKITPKPCLIMSNHQTVLDPFIMAVSYKRPLYYVTSDDLLSIKFVSPIIEYLTGIIPKSKSKSDMNTIRITLKVLKEGGTVALFPEGNRTLSGDFWGIDVSAAKLAKMAKVPLVFFNIKGGYGTDPRWGGKLRKGKMTSGVVKVISPEELEKMTVEELHKEIEKELGVRDYESGVEFKSTRSAEYLERALYYCPNCKKFNTLKSDKHCLTCTSCGAEVEHTKDLKLKVKRGEIPFDTVKEWFDYQKQALKDYAKEKDDELFFDEGVEARLIENGKRKKLGVATITAKATGCKVVTKSGWSCEFDFCSLYGSAILGKKKVNFYLSDTQTLQIKGTDRFNGIKYVHLYDFIKEKNNG